MVILFHVLTLTGFASLICIYSFMLIFPYFTGCISHLSLIIFEQNICFSSFRSRHWEIFYKIVTAKLNLQLLYLPLVSAIQLCVKYDRERTFLPVRLIKIYQAISVSFSLLLSEVKILRLKVRCGLAYVDGCCLILCIHLIQRWNLDMVTRAAATKLILACLLSVGCSESFDVVVLR